MRLRNNTVCNQSVYAKVVGSVPTREFITIVGEATLELDDDVWLEKYEEVSQHLLDAGTLEITKAPKLTDEQVKEIQDKKVAAARKLLAEVDKKTGK